MEQSDQPKSMTFNKADALEGMPEEVHNAQIGPCIGVAAIALNMAMKYHDIATIQDGTLYQQYKLEGRNMMPLDMSMVFHTAMQIEAYLIAANKRVAKLLVLSALDDEMIHEDESQDGAAPDTPTAASDAQT